MNLLSVITHHCQLWEELLLTFHPELAPHGHRTCELNYLLLFLFCWSHLSLRQCFQREVEILGSGRRAFPSCSWHVLRCWWTSKMCTAEQSVPATAPCIRCHTLNRKKSSFSFKYRIRFFSLEGRTQYCPSGFGADGDVDSFFFRKTCRAGRGLGLWFGAVVWGWFWGCGFGVLVLVCGLFCGFGVHGFGVCGFWVCGFWSIFLVCGFGSVDFGSVVLVLWILGPWFCSVV